MYETREPKNEVHKVDNRDLKEIGTGKRTWV